MSHRGQPDEVEICKVNNRIQMLKPSDKDKTSRSYSTNAVVLLMLKPQSSYTSTKLWNIRAIWLIVPNYRIIMLH